MRRSSSAAVAQETRFIESGHDFLPTALLLIRYPQRVYSFLKIGTDLYTICVHAISAKCFHCI